MTRGTMEGHIQVFTTTKKKDDAGKIARDLVEMRLAACAQIVGPIRSIYRWKGKIEEEEEWLCILKSRYDCYEKIEKRLKDIHPYEEPEILALSVVQGSRNYLSWLDRQVSSTSEKGNVD
jgi:periplasmic divalent cation tolerance protein